MASRRRTTLDGQRRESESSVEERGSAVSRRTKFILAALVLVVGVGLAWQFRKRDGQPPANGQQAAPFATASQFGAAASPVNSGLPSADAGAHSTFTTAATAQESPQVVAPSARLETHPKQGFTDDRGVPELSTAYPGAVDGQAKSPVPSGGDFDGRSFNRIPRLEDLNDLASGPTHKVADGDTLAQLAQRYLGSADRSTELYEFNRDVLSSPELLPIGAELRIPTTPFSPAQRVGPSEQTDRKAAGPQTAASQSTGSPIAQPVSQPVAAPVEPPKAAEANLVPVQSIPPTGGGATPAANKGAPKFQRLPPVGPVARVLRVAPQTYVVRPGDTLNSIAEKLYGDGARESILLEANRNLLPGGQSVRPGMVLVVPLDGRE